MQNLFRRLAPLLSLLIFFELGCRKQDQQHQIIPEQNSANLLSQMEKENGRKFDSHVLQSWYSLMLNLVIETPGHTPPIAARSFGYTGVALYESLVGGMQHHQSLVGQLNGLNSIPTRKYGNSYFAPEVANAAIAKMTKYLFANASVSNLGKVDALETSNEKIYAKEISQEIIDRSRDYGRAVSEAVYNWSKTDGGHEAYLNNFPTDYVPPVGEDKWIPTPPQYQRAMLPYWGNNRPMVFNDQPGPVDPPLPPSFSSAPGSPFYAAAYEVYSTSLNLSPEQTTIALFWADGGNTFTPPGHNVAIALQMIRNQNLNLNQGAILLAKQGIALNDGSIVCWRSKFITNLIRPGSFIRQYIDPSWMSFIGTPPFPTYTSGHSTFSGASAGILTAELGSQVSFMDSTKMADGFSPRSFGSFNEAAQEAAISRLYGGIHYSFDNNNGFICGQSIAVNVEALNW